MHGNVDLDDPTTVALAVAEAFRGAGTPHALYGGLLLAAYGEPRETKDADVAVLKGDAAAAGRILEAAGIRCQVAFDAVRFGGLLVSRLTLVGGAKDTGLNTLDVVEPRSARYALEAIGRAATAPLRDGEVTVLGPEDFVIFKALSTRERDLHDAASVLRRTGERMDASWIESEIERLAAEIRDHDAKGRWSEIRRQAGSAGAPG